MRRMIEAAMHITATPALLSDAHRHARAICRQMNTGEIGRVRDPFIVWTAGHNVPVVVIRSDALSFDADGRETHGRYWTVTADRWTDSAEENIGAAIQAVESSRAAEIVSATR